MELAITIDGKVLEIERSTSISFVRSNALFDFQKLVYTRSTSLSVPRTRANELLLNRAGNTHGIGAMMRKKVVCTIMIDGVPESGYLYINSADKSKYNCNLYVGEYVGDIFSKSISDFFTADELGERVVYGSDELVETVQQSAGKLIANTRYYTEQEADDSGYKAITYGGAMPSVSIDLLLQRIFGQSFDSGARVIGDVGKVAQGASSDVTIVFGQGGDVTITGGESGEFVRGAQPQATLQAVSISSTTGARTDTKKRVYKVVCTHDVYIAGYAERMIYTGDYYIDNISIWRDENDYFIAAAGPTADSAGVVSDYKVVPDSVEVEEDVRKYAYFRGNGKTNSAVVIPAGTEFRVASLDQHTPNTPSTQHPTTNINLLRNATGVTVYAKYRIVKKEDVLPTMSVSDLLRTYARLKGVLFYYDGKKIVEVESMQEGGTIDKVISWSAVQRKFSDFAQRTYIAYADDDENTNSAVYEVANETLTESTTKTLPIGCGVRRAEQPTATVAALEQKYPIAGTEGSAAYMLRKELPENAIITRLCASSTQIKVRYRTSYYSFRRMRYNSLLIYDNVQWVWLSSTWQDGIAEITLQKL